MSEAYVICRCSFGVFGLHNATACLVAKVAGDPVLCEVDS